MAGKKHSGLLRLGLERVDASLRVKVPLRGLVRCGRKALDWNAHAKGERRPDNWLHPPRGMVGRVLRHMEVCGARGTVVVPLNTREIWWPLVAAGAHGAVWRDGAPMRMKLHRRRGLLWKQGRKMAPGYRDLLVVRLDFAKGVAGAPCDTLDLKGTREPRLRERRH